jgi:PPM family protein phosphatase
MAENFFGITDRGKIRENNEDTFIAEKIAGGKLIAACVIDGVGGYEGGEVAAQIAKDCISEHLHNVKEDITAALTQAIIESNENIYKENQLRNQQQPMACVLTLAVADVEGNQFHYAHVGDTRLYLLRGDTLVKVTHDHSFVGFLEDSGRLSEEEAMKHPKRNEINKALGFDLQIQSYADYIETGNSPFLPGDILLLCSDGLTDMVNAGDITNILIQNIPLAQKAEALIAAANEAGGKDNVTVVLVHNNKKPLKQKAAKPKRAVEEEEDGAVAEPVVPPAPRRKRGSSKPVIAILTLLCVISIAGFLWQLLKNNKVQSAAIVPQEIKKDRNEQELKLQSFLDTVTAHKVKLNDSIFGKIITLTDTLIIDKDSLVIDGNGIMLRASEGYKNVALLVSEKSTGVYLQNIILENFDIGLLAQSKAVGFLNVQFRNCPTSIQFRQTMPDYKYVGGALVTDTTFLFDR